MTTMDDTVCDFWAPSDLGFADLFDNGHDDTYDLDFGDSSPRVKLPSTAPLDPGTELNSSEMENTWALGSPLKGRAPLTRTASIEFAFGKVRGLKRDASLDKIFVSPMNMETWGEDSGASAATDVSAAPAPAAPTAFTAAVPPVVAPPVPGVTAPPAVAPAAPVIASAAPTMPEPAPAGPKNKNKRKGAQKKGRTAQAEDDAGDDAAATAQSNPKTTQAAGTTQRQRSTAASTKAPAASSRVPSAPTRASTSTARATAADDAAPYAPRATSRAARRAAKAQRAMQSLMDADSEDAPGADVAEATSANASGNTSTITEDAANLTPSPTRTPPLSASTTAPAGALDRVAAYPQVSQSVDAAPFTRAHATGDVQLTPARVRNMPDINAIHIAPPVNAFYPPHAPAYRGLVVPAPWYHNVVLAAQPHAMFNGQPMLPGMMPPPTMIAPPMQYQTNAPAPAIGLHAQRVSSTQYGPWVPPSHPTSIEPPAPAPYYNAGAPSTQASGQAYPPMRAASGPSSSRARRYTSFVDSNGTTRVTSPFPQRASRGIMPGGSSGATAGGLTSNVGQDRMDALAVARLLAQSKGTGIPDNVRKVVEEQFPEIVAKMHEHSPAWALQDTTPPPRDDKPKRDFSRGEPVLCKLEHDRGKPPCRHVFMVDRSKIDDDAYKSDYERHVLKHLEHSAFKLWPCWWKGCNNKHPFMGTKNGIGHHVAEHIFKELRERILRERQEQILRERQEQRLKEVQDLGGQPTPKRARYH